MYATLASGNPLFQGFSRSQSNYQEITPLQILHLKGGCLFTNRNTYFMSAHFLWIDIQAFRPEDRCLFPKGKSDPSEFFRYLLL